MAAKRNTVQRQLILDAVRELNIHATAEQVCEHVHKKQPSISKATVYRNLHQMTESGDLQSVGYFYGATRYDHNNHEHCHFICEKCKRVIDVEGDFSDIMKSIHTSDEFAVTSCRVSFSGVCRQC